MKSYWNAEELINSYEAANGPAEDTMRRLFDLIQKRCDIAYASGYADGKKAVSA